MWNFHFWKNNTVIVCWIHCCFCTQVRETSINHFYFFNPPDTYVIPFGDGIVSLGGTCQFNVWDTRVRPHDSKGIRERCAAALPSLATAPVAWEWAGLRPYRETVRVEPEIKGNLKVEVNPSGYLYFEWKIRPDIDGGILNWLRYQYAKPIIIL